MISYSSGKAGLSAFAVVSLLIGVCVLAAWRYMLGSVIVRDPDKIVAEIVLRDSIDRISAARLPLGFHVSAAKLEGDAVIRCRNGKEVSLGYITGGWHIRRTVRAQDCSPTAPVVLNS